MLPELGENIEAADVLHVLVKKGDLVEVDQPVLEIETDKATIEVPASFAGRIKEVYVKDGEKVKVGQVVYTVEAVDAIGVTVPEPAAPAAVVETATEEAAVIAAPAAPDVPVHSGEAVFLEMKLPDLGENIASADVLKINVKVGDVLNIDETVLEIETDKATIEVPSTVSGTVVEVYLKDGDKATVGQVILKVSSQPVAVAAPVPVPVVEKAPAQKPQAAPSAPPSPVKEIVKSSARFVPVDSQPPILANPAPAAPSVRRIARELGVNINNVKGTGEHGRISMDDVKAYVKSLNLEARASSGGAIGLGIKAESLPDFTKFGPVEVQTMSNIRAKTAEHLSYAWATIPHVTQFDKADITDLENLRKYLAPGVEAKGGKLTVTAILIRVIASALKQFPNFNSSVDLEKKEIIYKKYVNVGVAVDTERGLIVPVIRNVDKKNVTEICIDMNAISAKAKARKISPDDLQGGCFTISNLGGIGGTYFTPIVNSPEVAILGVSRGVMEQVYKNGQFVPRLMLPLSLSYDHRIIDGADAIRFLRWVIEALEQPLKLLIEG